MEKINKNILNQVITLRNPVSYKGNYGKILIIAGSTHFGGAAILCSSAAVASGAGLVTVATVPEKFTAINTRIPEAMTIDYQNKNDLLEAIQNNTVIAIGPGLGISSVAKGLVKVVLKEATKNQTVIIDASALTLIAEEKIPLTTNAKIIMTPHQGEWERLSTLKIHEQNELNNIDELHKLNPKAALVLKKHHSEIYYQGKVLQITAGNAGMATGGMGDTLTGIMAGFIGQFGFSIETISAALLIHSYIADKLNKKHYVILPSLLIEKLPKYMASFSYENGHYLS
ncbi:NAD(P)H-hydrate dehydratase [Companilactobacillus halodurans]|uniref:ADP-dependent (S)-NAD(P)H-hydrate dehydratase n=1 Tax=Companilactobacillus halodurans TaxID=2584183 RepID=A0A5P0ZN40_9LACO|nr:NAD(P)H-hydrate dehydratase [Companilactobacillus halodurans]MQS75596.1 NAD(P)H-hydrate dehydratase [Companilactobacillus halodurans]MQS96309.1 NAD(P)H-hydrate dehydratase [Companilactobacillus halodurans]